MSIRVSGKTLRNTVAIAAILAASSGLAGCSTLGLGGDDITTGSTGYQGTSNLNQPMPAAVGSATQIADGPYIPPEDIGSGSPPPMLGHSGGGGSFASLPPASSSSSISSQDLPVLGSAPSNGSYSAMSAQPAQQPFPPASAAPRTEPSRLEALRSEPAKPVTAVMSGPQPSLSVIPGGSGTYTHVIRSGESLYTIARHYGVTAQAIMQASNIGAPDKIHVGQRVVIPGRADLLAAMDSKPSPESAAKLPVDSATPVVAQQPAADVAPATHRPAAGGEVKLASLDKTPAVPLAPRASAPLPPAQNTLTGKTSATLPPLAKPAAKPIAAPAAAPTQVASAAPAAAAPKMPLQEPAMSGADKFRWPVTGKVITNFTASHETGINIAAPEGTPVKAAENGTVIYVGSGVEGYGNLVLIRHANGYVSAYANLKDMSVAKGAVVARGDTIGSTGATGAVSSPQLHFELRKGATPVDPVPLLAG